MKMDIAQEVIERSASLQLSRGSASQVLTAKLPYDVSDAEMAQVGQSALDLVRKLTGCNCLSGRISFVVQDNLADVIRINFRDMQAGL